MSTTKTMRLIPSQGQTCRHGYARINTLHHETYTDPVVKVNMPPPFSPGEDKIHASLSHYRMMNITQEETAPQTQGYTVPAQNPEREAGRNPAYAGILLTPTAPLSSPTGSPRIRRDTPKTIYVMTLHIELTPHTQGYTREAPPRDQRHHGNPAYAGSLPT